jgi:uncharacterized protein YbjT (DUF2867 family)
MKVILFGATGMVGQGVLRECLRDPEVESVLVVVRGAGTGQRHDKLQELVHADLFDLAAVQERLSGYDACFFCLGVSSGGMKEAKYQRVTYDLTMAVANALVARNRDMTFVYVSGRGTDSSEQGRTMWARVKGKTENALLKLPFKQAFMFRPALIRAERGIVSKTKAYRVLYSVFAPLLPVLKALFPTYVTTTREIGRAMLQAAKHGAPKPVLESQDISALGSEAAAPGATSRSRSA